MTLREIAELTGLSIRTVHRRLRPKDDADGQAYWQELLDLQIRDHGTWGLLHASAKRVHAHLHEIRGEDAPAPVRGERRSG